MISIKSIISKTLIVSFAFGLSSCGGDDNEKEEPPYVAPSASSMDMSELPGSWTLTSVVAEDSYAETFNLPLTFGTLNFEASNGLGQSGYNFDITNPETWDNDGGTCLTQNGKVSFVGFSLTCSMEDSHSTVSILGGNVDSYNSQTKTLILKGYINIISVQTPPAVYSNPAIVTMVRR